MPTPKSVKTELARRREQVADFYIQGWTQVAIAQHLEVSQGTVSLDLKAIQKLWRESAIRNFDVLRERELKKLDRLEREAWAAWEKSKKPAQSAIVNVDDHGQRTQKKVVEQHGDPRYLEQIHKCIAGRRALLGLDAPTKIAPTSPDGDEAYHSHVMSELMKLAESSPHGPEVIDCHVIEKMLLEGPDAGPHEQDAEDQES